MSETDFSKQTSNSILEFLQNEKCCAVNFECSDFFEQTFNSDISEVEENFVFEEIQKHCAGEPGEIGEILAEAENLIKQRPKLFPTETGTDNESKVKEQVSNIQKPTTMAKTEKPIPKAIAAPPALTQYATKPISNVQHSPKRQLRPTVQSPATFAESKPSSPRLLRHESKISPIVQTRPLLVNNHLNKSFVTSISDQFATVEKRFCDKSTTPSPTHHSMSHSVSWSKERELEKTIEELQEKLKDMAERFQSLKIQHDLLSQSHRVLREDHVPMQEEVEKLKLDVQHLTECANVLRNELHAARSDRDAALEIQKILRADLDESRQDRKKFQEQTEKDAKHIQDLQRQCKEMERILMRKHPDSVSALIVASKGSDFTLASPKENASSLNTRKVLESRIAQLEQDALQQDRKSQSLLADVQARFNSVQSKYETHIGDLETQVLSLQDINAKLGEKVIRKSDEVNRLKAEATVADSTTMYTQTEDVAERDFGLQAGIDIAVQTDPIKPTSASSTSSNRSTAKKSQLPQQTPRLPNSHSDSVLQHGQGDPHLLATIRGMRYDLAIKEKAVQRLTREVDECKKTIKKLQREVKDDAQKSGTSSIVVTPNRKIYDSAHYMENHDTPALKDAQSRIKFLEKDYKILHEKRLSDLKTLQAAHEKELQACQDTIGILQHQLSEKENQISNEKRRNHHQVDYYALKAKVSSLERRHSEREKRLHLLVEALSQGKLANGINHQHHNY